MDLWDDLCVNSDEMKTFAQNNDYIFMETSAKTGQNVNAIFAAIGENIYNFPSYKIFKLFEF